MTNEFEKLDEKLTKLFEKERSQPFSQEELNSFHSSVMKKISERHSPAPTFGMPHFGLVMALAFSGAVILGTILYVQQIRVAKTEPAAVSTPEIKPVAPELLAKAALISQSTARPAAKPSAQVSKFKDSEIVQEIEALKEIGAWTDEDEKEAGIPVEVTFSDLTISPESYAPAITPG